MEEAAVKETPLELDYGDDDYIYLELDDGDDGEYMGPQTSR